MHTGGSSFAYLSGHIWDFYEVNLRSIGGNNYLPSTYILYTIWNAPLKIMNVISGPTFDVGYIIFWYKLLPVVFLFGSAIIIYKIGVLLGLNNHNAFILTAFWLTSPILIFSQFIFGQYDIFTVFFALLGYLFYLKRKLNWFIFFFAISLTFKYFPIFIFIPLLLLIEKRVSKILAAVLLVMIPVGLEVLPYLPSEAFINGIFGFKAAQHVSKGGTGKLFIGLWLLFCGYIYLKRIRNDNEFQQATLYIPMAVLSALFSLIIWNPQWLLWVTPFLALTSFFNRNRKIYMILDIIMMLFFVAFTVNNWPGWVDQSLWSLGLFKDVNPGIADPQLGFMMKDIYISAGRKMYGHLLTLCFLFNIIAKFPFCEKNEGKSPVNYNDFDGYKIWNFIRVRFYLGTAIFVIPAVICLLYSNPGQIIINHPLNHTAQAVAGDNFAQTFGAAAGKINKLVVEIPRDEERNFANATFRLVQINDSSSERVIYDTIITDKMISNGKIFINLNGREITKGGHCAFSLLTTRQARIWQNDYTDNNLPPSSYINGKLSNAAMAFSLYGEN